MATVHGRCSDLGIGLNQKQRSNVGMAVSAFFKGSTDATRKQVKFAEEGCKVWDYSENVTEVIDACIMAIANPPPPAQTITTTGEKPKRKRISAIKIDTNG